MTAATAIASHHLDRPALQRRQSFNDFVRIKADRLRAGPFHSSTPHSQHPEISDGESRMTLRANGRTIREQLPIDKTDESELRAILRSALADDFGEKSAKHKRVAEVAQAQSEKSAENWYNGRGLPSLLYGLRLIAHSPSLQKEVMRLCALEADLSPTFQRELSDLTRRIQALERA